jgi:SAM-dependent methyltransferase
MGKYNKDDAYKLLTSDGHRNYYNEWAKTYDKDFVEKTNYIYPCEISKEIIKRAKGKQLTVADIGCGTGLIGVHLHPTGWDIDGFDISQGMLKEAELKNVYKNLICLDLRKEENFPDRRYSALISSGTFTHGHLGPDILTKTLKLCQKDAICVIGVNAEHYVLQGFSSTLSALESQRIITDFETCSVPIYSEKNVPDRERNLADLCIFRYIGID